MLIIKLEKKEALLERVNQFLGDLYKSVAEENQVKKEIRSAYNKINRPEKISQKYDQISQTIRDLNYNFQQLAL
ncbi:hypothetical protein [Companilactobacillus alimentarius]|uniref:Uncharacterized protein n=1 Tax=Companilactobacillus alimentarius DSM 20249 TaxID=1423720 RepID=A0A2K9HQZ3_9LACO|nr:hypothetical protein [Companilactobacillus alimentarius]AUI72152.1 hypothetical protein LA20249_08135 [Companilactobacillus alimentarius DSM 20249]